MSTESEPAKKYKYHYCLRLEHCSCIRTYNHRSDCWLYDSYLVRQACIVWDDAGITYPTYAEAVEARQRVNAKIEGSRSRGYHGGCVEHGEVDIPRARVRRVRMSTEANQGQAGLNHQPNRHRTATMSQMPKHYIATSDKQEIKSANQIQGWDQISPAQRARVRELLEVESDDDPIIDRDTDYIEPGYTECGEVVLDRAKTLYYHPLIGHIEAVDLSESWYLVHARGYLDRFSELMITQDVDLYSR